MSGSKKVQQKIDPDTMILEITELYPEVIDFLINEYEIHCAGCIMAGFETLRMGATAHGINDKDFDEMIERINQLINKD